MSKRESIEVERKFDVGPDTPVPELQPLVPDGRAGIPQRYELVATYFDTPARDLAAHRITLRRRTGDTDAGWHLKRSADGAARRETRVGFAAAPAEGPVPEELRATVLAIVRDRPLVPIAEITTERTVTTLYDAEGASLAEFCQDRVLAFDHAAERSREWTEWEFELTGGDRKLLKAATALLRGAGARRSRAASKLARAVGAEPHVHARRRLGKKPTALEFVVHAVGVHRDALIAWDPQVRENADDAIHQMRVTARKLRALLSGFSTVLAAETTEPLIGELRELGQFLGDARDREVQLEINAALLADEPEVPADLRHALIDAEHARQERAVGAVARALCTERYLRLLDGLDRLLADPPPGPDAERRAGAVAREAVTRAAIRLRRAERKLRALEPWSAEWLMQLHTVRKRTKAVRYTAEAAAPLRLPEIRKTARHAERIQKHLGAFWDTVINRAQLARVSRREGLSPRAQFVLGRLDAREQARGRAAVKAYRRTR